MSFFFDEEKVDEAIKTGDRETLCGAFLALSRWVISSQVRTPAWMDRRDLVQLGVEVCFKILPYPSLKKPRFSYLAEAIKNDARRAVLKDCKHTPSQADEDHWSEDDHENLNDELKVFVKTEAGRFTFREVTIAFHQSLKSGRCTKFREFLGTEYAQENRAKVRRFLTLVSEQVNEEIRKV